MNEFIARNGIIAQNNSTVSGSLTVTGGLTGSIQGTATTASYVLNAVSSSYATKALSASYAPSAGATLTAYGQTLFVDATNGNDSTALLGRIDLPYKTISASVVAAQTGSTVYVYPGTYNDTNIFKDGVNYYFVNGATIKPANTSSVFLVNNPVNDVNIDGALTVNTNQNGIVFDIQNNASGSNYFIKFKQIIGTTALTTDAVGSKSLIRFANTVPSSSLKCYANVQGDIKFTSTLNAVSIGAFYTINDAVNLTYQGNIICTSTACAFKRASQGTNTTSIYSGFFSSTGATYTFYLASGNQWVYEMVNGTIANTSVANGVYAFTNSSNQYSHTTVNANIIGNVLVTNSYIDEIVFNGNISGYGASSPVYVLIQGTASPAVLPTNCTINGNISFGSIIMQGGNAIINGAVELNAGNFTSQGLYTQTGGVMYWKGYGQFYTTNTINSSVSNTITSTVNGGKLVIAKGSVFQLSALNSSGVATQHGLQISGGIVQVEGKVEYASSGYTANLAAIKLISGSLILDGGTIINRLTSPSASILVDNTGSTTVKIYNNTFSNLPVSGTYTNAITNGGGTYYSNTSTID